MSNPFVDLASSESGQDPELDFEPDGGRSGCLTVYLVLGMIGNVVGGLVLLTVGVFRESVDTLAYPNEVLPGVGRVALVLLGLLGFVTAFFFKATYDWKRWGLIGTVCLLLLWPVLNAVVIGQTVGAVGMGLGFVILYLLFRKHLHRFE